MSEDCIFCRIAGGTASASIIAETPDALAFMDIDQPTPGHVLIIPRTHVRDIWKTKWLQRCSGLWPATSATAIASGWDGKTTMPPASNWIAWLQRSERLFEVKPLARGSEPADSLPTFGYIRWN